MVCGGTDQFYEREWRTGKRSRSDLDKMSHNNWKVANSFSVEFKINLQ